MNKLTVIITCLNEGYNLKKTLSSIRATAGRSVDIIVINDGSDDGYDYGKDAKRFKCKYYENDYRQGVAKCRDMGVYFSKTENCLLIDCHMWFFDDGWVDNINLHLSVYNKTIGCTLCGHSDEIGPSFTNRGAGSWLNYSMEDWSTTLLPRWAYQGIESTNEISEVPVVLGANYFFKKKWYNHIGGLLGLRSYGSDEFYISVKSWLAGGSCTVLNNVQINHMFRGKQPYSAPKRDATFNKGLVVLVVAPEKVEWLSAIEKHGNAKGYKDLETSYETVEDLRNMFVEVQTRDIEFFIEMNDKFKIGERNG